MSAPVSSERGIVMLLAMGRASRLARLCPLGPRRSGISGRIKDSVATWWGSNQWAKDAVRRTLSGGRSGRIVVFGIAAAFLAVGIYGGSLLLSVASGIAIVAAAGALVRAARDNRAVRRMERRYDDSPDGRADQAASSGSAVPDQ